MALSSGVRVALVLAVLCPQCCSSDTPTTKTGFLGAPLKPAKSTSAPDVVPVLMSALGSTFDSWGEEDSARLAIVENKIKPFFEAQPKDFWFRSTAGSAKTGGILAPEALRAVTYSYFAQEHGWLIKDLEPPYMVKSSHSFHEVSALRKAPAMVEALKALEMQNRGLSLGDLAAVVTAIERVLVDESAAVLKAAYKVNELGEKDPISIESLHTVLQSYLLIFRGGSDASANVQSITGHMQVKSMAEEDHQSWTAITGFETEAIERWKQLHGKVDKFSLQAVEQIVRDMALHYGKWQDVECEQMSKDLQALDANRAGRVPFATFHRQERNPVYGYQFTETVDYLRETGSLEEQGGKEPQVVIANYVLGPSNCMATTDLLSVCCLNSCEALAGEVYRQVRSSSVTPAVLANIARNLSTPLAVSPTEKVMFLKEPKVIQELYDIAARSKGMVMLSTPAFRQWLHLAFPSRCPSLHPSAQPVAVELKPEAPVITVPTRPPSHWPNTTECTRMPEYFL